MKISFVKKNVAIIIAILFIGLNITSNISAIDKNEIINNNLDYKLIIISPSYFVKKIEPLVDHKINNDISTKLVSLNEIYDSEFTSDGRDDAEKIKYFIKYAIENWSTEYVLLIGGKIWQFPIWHCPVRYVNMGNDWEAHFISDLYFSDIYDSEGGFSSWDSNNDGVYGEWMSGDYPVDKYIDLYPDVAVGRLPCRNIFEVEIMVDKIIDYETNAFGEIWFNDMVVIAGDTYLESSNPLWVGYEGEFYAELALENMSGFNHIRLFTSDDTFTGESDVIDALNNGCGFVYFVGHGSPRSWGNHPPNDHNFTLGLSVTSMNELNNEDMYPVCVVSGCHNLQFDVSLFKVVDRLALYRGEASYECWGWRMTRNPSGGSIASFGTSALGYTKEDKSSFEGGINELEVQLFKQYGSDNVEIIGDMLFNSINWYLDTYPINWDLTENNAVRDTWVDVQVMQSYVLFGDPTLMIGGYQ